MGWQLTLTGPDSYTPGVASGRTVRVYRELHPFRIEDHQASVLLVPPGDLDQVDIQAEQRGDVDPDIEARLSEGFVGAEEGWEWEEGVVRPRATVHAFGVCRRIGSTVVIEPDPTTSILRLEPVASAS